jgi:hypothetical protein
MTAGTGRLWLKLRFLQEVDKRTGYRKQMLVAPILDIGVIWSASSGHLRPVPFAAMVEEACRVAQTIAVALRQRQQSRRSKPNMTIWWPMPVLSAEFGCTTARRKGIDMGRC